MGDQEHVVDPSARPEVDGVPVISGATLGAMPHGVSRIERVAILTFSVSGAAPLTRRRATGARGR